MDYKDRRVDNLQDIVAESEPLHNSCTEVVDNDIAPLGKADSERTAPLGLEIQAYTARVLVVISKRTRSLSAIQD